MGDTALVRALRSIAGDRHVLTDPAVTESYAVDWTGRFHGHTPVVVRPGSTDEVAEVVQACRAHGAAVVPQGGNTGLVGGGVPLDGEVVVSLRRLAAIADVDPVAGQLTAGGGVTLAAVHDAARAAGWEYGVDLAARDSATIGGNVATNAGGLRVLRFGATSAQVVGVEAVLGDASVVAHMSGLIKDNTGYHLPSLLCGSEGTLGLVTAVRVRLVPGYPKRVVALLGFASTVAAVEACATLRLGVPSLDAVELLLADGIDLVERSLGLPPPMAPAAAYLLVECADVVDPSDTLAAAVDGLATTDVAVAVDGPRQAELWRYREGHSEAINGLGPPHKFDVTLPAAALATFIDEVRARIAALAPDAATWIFGHAADGNLHVNVTGLPPDDERVDDAVLTLAAGMGGSISAEHGIGTAKKRWLHLNRTPSELAAMRAIKRALDPDNILNPNVLL